MDAERLSAAPSEPADLDRTGRQEPTAPRGSATAREAAALAARTSDGRLVSLLAAGNGDVISAEDALAAAFEQALRTWPETGVPRSPAAWLLTVARNRLRDQWKSAATRTSVPLTGAVHPDGTVPGALTSPAGNGDPFEWIDMDAIGDKRLELLFVCGHPAIDPAARTPLMLQTVLGFDAAQIARAFAVSPAAMAKRLVRAKRRIAVARIPFTVPDRQRLPERLAPVLEAVYGCFALGRDVDIAGPHRGEESMVGEAQYLAETLADLLQTEPEAWGLAALITLSRARMGPGESFVPLADQDPSAWDRGLIATGSATCGGSVRSRSPAGSSSKPRSRRCIAPAPSPDGRTGRRWRPCTRPWCCGHPAWARWSLRQPSKPGSSPPRPPCGCWRTCVSALRRQRRSSRSTRPGPTCSPARVSTPGRSRPTGERAS